MGENEKIIGKYVLKTLLGSGGMGEVWLSHHPGLDIPVAIKILKTDNDNARKRFIQEGKLAASINHQNIVRVFDAGSEGDDFYLVMEYIEGGDYKSVADEKGGILDIESTVSMGISICGALSTAHKNRILHRDIKPENILLSKEGEIKLADLGIAKLEGGMTTRTMENSALGTPYYISPEQAQDASSVDKRTDIYSLGATLYHLVTGTYPFKAKTPIQMLLKHMNEPLENPTKRNSFIPESLSEIICKMMDKDPDARYQDCEAVLKDLQNFKNNFKASEQASNLSETLDDIEEESDLKETLVSSDFQETSDAVEDESDLIETLVSTDFQKTLDAVEEESELSETLDATSNVEAESKVDDKELPSGKSKAKVIIGMVVATIFSLIIWKVTQSKTVEEPLAENPVNNQIVIEANKNTVQEVDTGTAVTEIVKTDTKVTEPIKVDTLVTKNNGQSNTKNLLTSNNDLEAKVIKIFDEKCSKCHVSRTTISSSRVRQKASRKWRGIDFMKELLNRQYDSSERDFKKQDIYYTLTEDMPPKNAKSGALTDLEKSTIVDWIKQGCSINSSIIEPIAVDKVHEAIFNDLQKVDDPHRRYIRYFTLTNLYNTPGEVQSLDLYRFALAKMINSISTGSRLIIPEAVEGTKETVYKIDIRDVKWSESLWDELMTYYPYHFKDIRGSLSQINTLAQRNNIIVRADWFNFIASQPPFYNKFLGNPVNQLLLEKQLGVDRSRNIQSGQVLRAGFEVSGISTQNRLLERHGSDEGYYWVSYDFKSNKRKSDLIENPLGPKGMFSGKKVFEHDGSEMIYSLANGLQGYYLASANGLALNIGPSDIVFDQSNARGGVIINGFSCISCHDQGLKSASGEIRSFVDDNPERYSETERSTIRKLYPGKVAIQKVINEDRKSFQLAMTKIAEKLFTDQGRRQDLLKVIGFVKGAEESVEPIRVLFEKYLERVDLDYMASTFGVSAKEFEALSKGTDLDRLSQRLKKNSVARDRLGVDLEKVASELGKDLHKAKELDLPIFNHNSIKSERIDFNGVDNLVFELQRSFINRDSNIALGLFKSEKNGQVAVSRLSVDLRDSIGRAIQKNNSLNLVRENEISGLEEIFNSFSQKSAVELSKLGIDFILGGTFQQGSDGSIKLSLKIINVGKAKTEQFTHLLHSFKAGKEIELNKEEFSFENFQNSAKNVSEVVEISKSLPSGFKVQISSNGKGNIFVEGQKMIFNVQSEIDAFIAIVGHQSDGTSVLLYPNELEKDNFLKAGSKSSIPNSKFDIVVAAPFGQDVLQVIASTSQEELNKLLDRSGRKGIPGTQYSTLNRELMRGLGVQGKSTDNKILFSQSVLKVHTVPKK